MSQESEAQPMEMNVEDAEGNTGPDVTKSEAKPNEQGTENNEVSTVSENDSSESDSGLQINNSQSLSVGDDSPQPTTDENLSSPQSITTSEGIGAPISSSESDKMVSKLAEKTEESLDKKEAPTVLPTEDGTNGPDKETKETQMEITEPTMTVTADEKTGAPNTTSLDLPSSSTAEEVSESPASKISKIESTAESESTVSKDTEVAVKSSAEKPEAATSMEGATASPLNDDKSPMQSVYHIKWIRFKDNMYPVVTQNENGPCPLLAIMNLLVLQGKIKMPPMVEMVTSGQLMEYLADCIFEHAPKNIAEDAQLNYEQNMHDAMAVFHKLQTGLDVNVKFTSVSTFEYTPECIVFDLLGIPLYHGWLVDPDLPNEVAAVGNCGYNQLVEKIITQKNSSREELVTEALIAEDFLNRTASQLTYHGLSELSVTLNDQQMCVFFRNNHFSTLYKHKNELFILVTDQGFLTESNVVWETLSNVEGDGHFVDAEFHTYRKPEASTLPIPQSPVPLGTDQQVDTDYLVALSLQQETQQQMNMQADLPLASGAGGPTQLSDHELAMRLQEEENRQAKLRQQQLANQQHLSQQHQQRMAHEAREKKKERSSDCVIL